MVWFMIALLVALGGIFVAWKRAKAMPVVVPKEHVNPDAPRINVNDPKEVERWTKELKVDEYDLKGSLTLLQPALELLHDPLQFDNQTGQVVLGGTEQATVIEHRISMGDDVSLADDLHPRNARKRLPRGRGNPIRGFTQHFQRALQSASRPRVRKQGFQRKAVDEFPGFPRSVEHVPKVTSVLRIRLHTGS